MRIPYDKDFPPPAPVVNVEVAHLNGQRFIPTLALIDSGADLSVMPRHLKERLAIPITETRSFGVADGSSCPMQMGYFRIKLAVNGQEYEEEVKGAISDDEVFLLGRDFLNKLKMTLDGPQEVLTIH